MTILSLDAIIPILAFRKTASCKAKSKTTKPNLLLIKQFEGHIKPLWPVLMRGVLEEMETEEEEVGI